MIVNLENNFGIKWKYNSKWNFRRIIPFVKIKLTKRETRPEESHVVYKTISVRVKSGNHLISLKLEEPNPNANANRDTDTDTKRDINIIIRWVAGICGHIRICFPKITPHQYHRFFNTRNHRNDN